MQKAEAGNVITFSGLTEDQFTTALIEVKARAMGHGFGNNENMGFYIELMPEGRTPDNLAAIEQIVTA